VSQISDAVDKGCRIAHLVGDVGRELHGEIGAGAALPADMNQERVLIRLVGGGFGPPCGGSGKHSAVAGRH